MSSDDVEATPEQVNQVFLDWANAELGQNYRSASEFNDGHKIYSFLQRVSREDFHDPLPEGSLACEGSWISRFNNLKHIGRRLDPFIQKRVPTTWKVRLNQNVNFKDLAEHASATAMTSLLRRVLVASVYSPDLGSGYLNKLREMPQTSQHIIRKVLETSESEGTNVPQESSGDLDVPFDNETMFEQREAKVLSELSRVSQEYNQLKDDYDALEKKHTSLQAERDRLEDRNIGLQDRVTRFRSGEDELAEARVNALRVESQMKTIASLEESLQKSEDDLAYFRESHGNLQQRAEKTQELQDELDEYKAKQPDLVRKASAFEKYQEKLRQSTRVEAENKELKLKNAELQEELKRSDTSTASSAGMRREMGEKQRLIEQLERDFHDNQQKAKDLIMANRRFETRNAELEAEQLRNRNEMESLERRLEQRDDSVIATGGVERLDLDSYQPESSPRSPRQDFSSLSEEQLRRKYAELESRNSELEEAVVTEEEMRHLLNAMKQRSQQTSEKTTESQLMMQQQLAAKIASGRLASKKTQQQLADQRALIAELTSRLTNASVAASTQQPPLPSPVNTERPLPLSPDQASLAAELKSAQDHIANLTRELRLVSSAWYDLQTRLQSPNVSVSRGRVGGTADPKSWLGRQRKLVDKALMGR